MHNESVSELKLLNLFNNTQLEAIENIPEIFSHFYLVNTIIWLLINRQAKNIYHDINHFSLLLITFENGNYNHACRFVIH